MADFSSREDDDARTGQGICPADSLPTLIKLLDSADPLLVIAAQYHSSARMEITQRIGHRDTALFLFLAGSATLFSLSLSPNFRPVLYAIPLLGLGASQVYCQHSIVIGALGRYLGYELHSWVRQTHPGHEVPAQWDSSESLLEMKGGGYLRPILISGLVLIALPQVLALVIMIINRPAGLADILGLSIGGAAALLTIVLIVSAHQVRRSYACEMKSYLATWRATSAPPKPFHATNEPRSLSESPPPTPSAR